MITDSVTPDSVREWATALSILGAIIFGGFAVFSPSWVWFRSQAFKYGSALLLGFGTVLLVSPLFRNVSFTIDTQRFELKLSALEQEIARTRTQVASLSQEIGGLPVVLAGNDKAITDKVQALRMALATIESELPKLAALGDQIKKVETTVASVESGVKKLDQQTTLLANLSQGNLSVVNWKGKDFVRGPGMAAFWDANPGTWMKRLPDEDLKKFLGESTTNAKKSDLDPPGGKTTTEAMQ